MLRIFTQLFVILVLWAGLGAATYWLHPQGRVLLAGGQAAVPQDETEVSLSEAKRLAMDGKVLWIDVRPAAEFAAEHVQGAENVPADQAGVLEGKLFEWTQSDRLRPDTTLVIYCASPGCGSGAPVAPADSGDESRAAGTGAGGRMDGMEAGRGEGEG